MPVMETEKNTHPQPPYQALAWSYRRKANPTSGSLKCKVALPTSHLEYIGKHPIWNAEQRAEYIDANSL